MVAKDPAASGAGQSLASYFYLHFGPDFVKKLYVEQKPTLTADARQGMQWLAQGNNPILIQPYDEARQLEITRLYQIYIDVELEPVDTVQWFPKVMRGDYTVGLNLTGNGLDGRVGMWRGGVRSTMSVAAPFVWRCLSGSAITPFPHPAHRTQQADFPHCALGQDLTPSPTTGRGRAGSDVRARSTRRGARVDSSRACVACPCA